MTKIKVATLESTSQAEPLPEPVEEVPLPEPVEEVPFERVPFTTSARKEEVAAILQRVARGFLHDEDMPIDAARDSGREVTLYRSTEAVENAMIDEMSNDWVCDSYEGSPDLSWGLYIPIEKAVVNYHPAVQNANAWSGWNDADLGADVVDVRGPEELGLTMNQLIHLLKSTTSGIGTSNARYWRISCKDYAVEWEYLTERLKISCNDYGGSVTREEGESESSFLERFLRLRVIGSACVRDIIGARP